MTPPHLSLLMVNYNRASYIETAINSVLTQTYPDWELIIVDDGSTDDSVAKIKPFLRDARIRFFANAENSGIVYSRLAAIAKAQAEIIGTIDSDDFLEPEAVEIMLQAHTIHSNAFIYSQMLVCDEKLNPLRPGTNAAILPGETNLIKNCVSHFLTFRKDAYLKTTGYDSLAPAEDKDIIYKLEEVSDPIFIDQILYRYRLNPSSESNYGYKKLRGRFRYFLAKYKAYRRRLKNNSPKKIKFLDLLPEKMRPARHA